MTIQNMVVSAAFFISACATTAPHREAAPPLSVQGLQVRIADVGCSLNQGESDYVYQTQGVVNLRLQIKNDSGRVARLSERRFRLVDSSAPGAPSLAPDYPQVLSLFPGEATELAVRFTTGDSLDCSHGFNLVLADAVQLAAPPTTALSSISIPVPR